jgi:hypothetical protein
MTILDHFDRYISLGLKVIVLYPNSKIPMGKKWNQNWNAEKSRELLEGTPKANLGLLLGNVVDIEGDSIEANELISSLIGDYPHPKYMGRKSEHHLFLNPDPQLTRLVVGSIEFRACNHQSVLPPSIHPNGDNYEWIVKEFPVPPMPESLLEFYQKNKKPFKKASKKASKPPPPKKKPKLVRRPWCSICQKKVTMNIRRYQLEEEAFKRLGKKWQCPGCRDFDIRKMCKYLKREGFR